MNQIKLYFDEDAMNHRLVMALRARGVTVVTVRDAGLTERTDAEQLAYATELDCVLFTYNVGDFYRLHTEWTRSGKDHAGIILARQQEGVGEQLRRLLRLRAAVTVARMRNQVEFLASWR